MLPHTHARFRCGDAAVQRLYDEAVRKCEQNLNRFGEDTVLVEGGGYEKIWLETQPMGGEMYARYNMEAALNNQLLFMRHQREDGRLAGSIKCVHEVGQRSRNAVLAEFNKFQGFCFPWPALNIYYWLGGDRAYLDMLAECLERFDAYLWKVGTLTATAFSKAGASTIPAKTTLSATAIRLFTAPGTRRRRAAVLSPWT